MYSPGPWETSHDAVPNHHTQITVYAVNGGGRIATVFQNEANADLIALSPELDAYRQYIEDNLDRIEQGGWTPVCFAEFQESEECANHMGVS